MLRVGLVGAGFMGRLHAAGWAKTPAQLVGVHALDDEAGAALVNQYGLPHQFPSFDALLDAVDVVDICTPTPFHRAMTLRAAAAGKHVVCEKPLALTTADARDMIAACQNAGVKLLVGHVVRYFPEYAQAKAIAERGEIGKIGVVRLTRVSARPERRVDNWFLDPARSGGMMLDLMVHDFDYARWVAGEVESVFARNAARHMPDVPGDYALAILRHTSGALSHVEGGWAYPPGYFRTGLEIAGEGGLIEHAPGSSTPIGLHLRPVEGSGAAYVGVPASPMIESPYDSEIKDFYQALAHDATPRVSAQDALAALTIAFAAIESARTGRRVTL